MPMLDEDAYRYAIRNAHAHSGKAEVGALIGKLKALHPQTDVKQLVPIAQEAVARVNSMDSSAISGEYTRFESEGFELHIPEKKGGLEDLAWADHEPVNTRYAPNPSAPGHLGHLRPALLSHRYASKYGGTFLLRFDDTDPKLKKPIAGGEQMYLEDLAWFGIAPDQVVRASDRLGLYHDYMRQLVGMGHAYVCTCAIEGWRKLTLAKKACPCREEEAGIQSQKLEQMLTHSFKQGEAVLRIKTDLTLDDPSQRDWWAARIVDNPHHYRVKDQYLWPSYNFASAIDDHVLNITLIIRGQEHYQNMLKQKWVYTHFGWAYPHSFHHGRLLMTGTDLSKSKMLEGILNGKYTGWDDPRLFT
ncbi:MAG: glutamate--tRNA ligase family protein, partial [archaeon]|nr:glutamate--tRNA ligase family protein [archaeon]